MGHMKWECVAPGCLLTKIHDSVYCMAHQILTRSNEKEINMEKSIRDHSGNKYVRDIFSCVEPTSSIQVDVYEVIEAFNVKCAPTQHALKKLLCAGVRGKGDTTQDLKEARDALSRAIEMEQNRQLMDEEE